jgi:hypothetical protein
MNNIKNKNKYKIFGGIRPKPKWGLENIQLPH